mmetsp:Transcript_10460/g.30608  ORF Transcript_10460/g.30608 Transcript_10460/m.30608 type:complete len:251 (+) Transcript_10460:453-1205(+)
MVELRGKNEFVQVAHGFSLLRVKVVSGKDFGTILAGLQRGDNLVHLVVHGSVHVGVVDHNNRIVLLGSGNDQLGRKSRSQGISSGALDFRCRARDAVTKGASHLGSTLVSNDEKIAFLSLRGQRLYHLSDSTRDERVDTTTKPLIGSERDNEGLLGNILEGCVFQQGGFGVNFVRPAVEWGCSRETVFISLQLCGGNQFHRRRNLFDVLRRLDLVENLLLGGHSTSLLCGNCHHTGASPSNEVSKRRHCH